MIGIGATLFKRAVMGSRGFSPSALFANGEEGAWYDPSDLSTLFQSSDGTTAVAVGDPVGYIADKSGNGNHAIQATSAKRPILRNSGSLYWLEFASLQSSCLKTGDIDFTATDSMTTCVGVQKDDDDTASIIELSANVGANTGVFRLASVSTSFRYISKGTSNVSIDATGFGATTKNVVTGYSDISNPSSFIRVDGVQKATSTSSQGSGNFGTHPLNVGARANGSSAVLDGNIYGVIIRNVVSSAKEIASTETYMASKAGVTI